MTTYGPDFHAAHVVVKCKCQKKTPENNALSLIRTKMWLAANCSPNDQFRVISLSPKQGAPNADHR